ncbi:MAG: type 1 glutamine amidotransferase [Bacteroidota bacterium]|nr:type 1 glutamine amidotransferase [Bacteroidota bacterium]
MKIHILQHVVFEPPGLITGWAKLHNYSLTHTFLFDENIYWPAVSQFDVLIILGGPMGVDEEDCFPWLKSEKKFIQQAIAADKIILGLCLGAQLLAEALGAKVYPNREKEIGFFPVTKTSVGKTDKLFSHIPENWEVFHWHGDTFDLPEGASLLFTSAACTHQSFRKGKCIGIQFHPEVDTGLMKSMIENERHELVKAAYVQTEEEIMKNDITKKNKAYFYDFLAKLVQ